MDTKSFILTILIVFCADATADIYKWTDASGKVHYGDRPEAADDAEKLDIKIKSFEGVTIRNYSYPSRSSKSRTTSTGSQSQKVVMYSTSWCKYCKKAKEHFKKNRIDFVEYDIEKDKKAKREYDRLGGKGVPVILVGNKRMNGFSAEGFDAIYN